MVIPALRASETGMTQIAEAGSVARQVATAPTVKTAAKNRPQPPIARRSWELVLSKAKEATTSAALISLWSFMQPTCSVAQCVCLGERLCQRARC